MLRTPANFSIITLETAHDAAENQNSVSSEQSVELGGVAAEEGDGGAEEPGEEHGQGDDDGQQKDQDAWCLQSHVRRLLHK